jgi:hypothetical protein
LPIISFNIIFEEAGYFGNFTISSTLRQKALYAFTELHKFQAWEMKIVKVIDFMRKFTLYVFTAAVNRRLIT